MARGALTFTGHVAATLALISMAAPAQAQLGSILRSASRAASTSPSSTSDGCGEGRSRSGGSRVAGGILGSVASSAAGGLVYYVPVAAFTDQITAAIACKLDPQEQEQAAEATLEATRGAVEESDAPEIGSTSSWTSNTREDVSGSSTVIARNDDAGGGLECVTVSDVIIVRGEETRADKRMCRRPPSARYALAA